MGYRLEFTVNQLPPSNTAADMTWRQKKTLRKKWEILIWSEILNRRPVLPLEFAHVEFQRHSSMEPDYDNLVGSFKWPLDALVTNGVLRDDKPSVIGQPKYVWRKAPPKKGKIVCLITKLDCSPRKPTE